MATSPTLVGKLLPYLSYFLYAQLALLCAAILVGIGIFLSRVLRKQSIEGDPNYTKERIAIEIHAEITRLRDLRDRIHPGFAKDAEAGGPAQVVTVTQPMTAEAKAALEAEIEKKFKEELDYLRNKNTELEAAAKAAPAAAPADGTAAPAPAAGTQEMADALANAAKEKGVVEEEAKTLKAKVEVLEKTLTEYQIFENDIALVKKYKAENEELRKQLSATPQVTEEDIASLFSAMVPPGGTPAQSAAAAGPATPAPAPVAVAPAPAPEPAPEPEPTPVVAESAPAPAPTKTVFEPVPEEAPVTAAADEALNIDDLLKEAAEAADAKTAAQAEVAPKAEPAPAPAPEPEPISASETTQLAGKIDSEDLEALAETDKGADDQLLAEFQKLLGDKS